MKYTRCIFILIITFKQRNKDLYQERKEDSRIKQTE